MTKDSDFIINGNKRTINENNNSKKKSKPIFNRSKKISNKNIKHSIYYQPNNKK